MSTHFYITPYDPKAWEDSEDNSEKPLSDLKIDRALFHTKLLEHWTLARVHVDGERWILTHEEDGNVYTFWVSLQFHEQVVAFSLDIEFILWYRAFIPSNYPLYLSNSSDWYNGLLLTNDMTAQDIMNLLE